MPSITISSFSFKAIVNETRITIRTGTISMAATLFLKFRKIEVDCIKQTIDVTTKMFYFIKRQTRFSFEDIRCLNFTFDEFDKSQEDGDCGDIDAYSFGKYEIIIITKSGLMIPVAKHYGKSDKPTLLIDTLVEQTGLQISVYVTKTEDYKDLLICAECGRASKNTFTRCQYCGGELC